MNSLFSDVSNENAASINGGMGYGYKPHYGGYKPHYDYDYGYGKPQEPQKKNYSFNIDAQLIWLGAAVTSESPQGATITDAERQDALRAAFGVL